MDNNSNPSKTSYNVNGEAKCPFAGGEEHRSA